MDLGPHHVQAQSRYFEDSVRFAVTGLCFAPYGLMGWELDREALHNGTVSLIHARGILPDGVPFQMPDCDPAPAAREISELFSPIRESLTMFLGIAPRRAEGANCALGGEGERSDTRYAAETLVVADENTGRDDKSVQVGRKQIRLLLDSEVTEDLVSLPIARVKRDASGHFVYDPNFIPPCLDIMASERLMTLLRQLIEILEDKSTILSQAKGGGGKTPSGWSAQDVASFWFLHAVNSGLAPLRHFCFARRGHPEQLFLELSRLAGALCTFGLESHPRTLPLYDHAHLQECFEALEKHIRFHLETIIPTNCVSIPLAPVANYFWAGAVADQRCLGRARWIFGIQSGIGEGALISKTPQLAKICSNEWVSRLVARALPGLTLTHLQVPPAAVSPKLETQYFGISRTGPCWDHIVKTREVGIYVPGEIPNPEIELLVVLES
jgi:type VI secretion system protein ImpJ